MEGYELGKDIQEIKQRIDALEEAISTQSRPVSSSGFVLLTEDKVEDGPHFQAGVQKKSGRYGRNDAGECECREQTLSVFSDGSYTHVAVHHNHSRYLDDGDEHRLTIHIRAGSEIVHSFDSNRFVPRGTDRTKQTEGFSENIKKRFDEIDNWGYAFECA